MTKVFVGGSRHLSKLNGDVRQRLDQIMNKRFPILIGDANGADKAVQSYLSHAGYDLVEVFCMDGGCRNNIGNWTTHVVKAKNNVKGFEYYSLKDAEMTIASSVGFMLWDGKSRGTLENVCRLVDHGKSVLVYIAPTREFRSVRSKNDLGELRSSRLSTIPKQIKRPRNVPRPKELMTHTAELF